MLLSKRGKGLGEMFQEHGSLTPKSMHLGSVSNFINVLKVAGGCPGEFSEITPFPSS